jgi:hypothetical protein
MRRLIWAGGIAFLLAMMVAVPEIAGIATWKFVLAAAGLGLFVLAGRSRGA